jgi:hypothetical protein
MRGLSSADEVTVGSATAVFALCVCFIVRVVIHDTGTCIGKNGKTEGRPTQEVLNKPTKQK